MTGPTGHDTEANGLAHLSDAEIAGYLDQALAPGERRQVETHIERCAACRGEIVALSRITHAEPVRAKPPQRRSRWWIAAAAAAVIAAIMLPRLTNNAPAPDTTERARRVTDTDGRSQLDVVSPSDGIVPSAPLVFTWRAANADIYRFVVLTERGDVVWTADIGDTTIALPDSVSLQPGHAYFWRVDAIGNGIAATTNQRRIEIPPR